MEVNIAEPLLRGVYLRIRDGSRKWISFVYERMPNYCYLCGLVGHLEKKCILRFRDGFVDPRKNFPYGEWLKAPVPGSGGRGEQQNPRRGVNIFEVGGEDSRGTSTVSGLGSKVNGSAGSHRSVVGSVRGVLESGKRKESRELARTALKPSQAKNRKKKAVELDAMEEDRPAKCQMLGDLSNLVLVMVEAALQPHRAL